MRRTLVAAALVVLSAGACSPGDPPGDPAGERPRDPSSSGPRLSWQECPGQVTISVTTPHRCGTLTVPVDHRDAEGPVLGLEVVQAWPVGEEPPAEAAASVGFNAGEPAHEPGLMSLLAERLGVAVVSVAPRGVGPGGGLALDCTEAAGLGAVAAPEPDDAGRDRFVAAVKACRERLVGGGVDLSLFGPDDVVADLEALRSALGVDRWHALVTYGDMAAVSDRFASAYPDRVRAVVKDSPGAVDTGPHAKGAEGTRSALAALFDECREDPRCATRYPDLERSWQQALDRAAARPLLGRADRGEVRVDAPRLLRAVRAMLGGDGPTYVEDLPRVITTAAGGEVHPTLARVVASDPDHCLGHRPLCTKPGFSLGAYLSQVCPDLRSGRAPRETEPVYQEVFGDSPYVEACAVWDVPATEPVTESARVPTLVLTGHLDSWSRAEWFDGAVSVRGATHDVAGSHPCVLAIRNPWVADPTTAPDASPCDATPFPAWD
ncbi:hypothetical protein ACK8HX_16945 [Oryzobacter sp. R7]|uniref:hypothetical protein n=1 Tax=Oryzobacter faecalis TaxID=3388656 RepID=UPI00398D1CFC